MEIIIKNLQKKIPINPTQITRIAKTVLLREGISQGILSIVFVTNQKIRALNKKFLQRNYATDVLAFDLRGNGSAGGKKPSKGAELAGDVVISTDAVIKNAAVYDTAVFSELTLYVIHGILHLLGFDDHSSRDIKRMRKKEQQLLKVVEKQIKKA